MFCFISDLIILVGKSSVKVNKDRYLFMIKSYSNRILNPEKIQFAQK